MIFVHRPPKNLPKIKSSPARDATLSKHVEKKLRQVERMQRNIQQWKLKILQNKSECEERNGHLRVEKEHLQRHFGELKGTMNRFREEKKARLAELSSNGESCISKLRENLGRGCISKLRENLLGSSGAFVGFWKLRENLGRQRRELHLEAAGKFG